MQKAQVNAANKFCIDESTVRYWIQREEHYKNEENKNKKSLNTGRKPESEDFEPQLIDWILDARKNKLVETQEQ